MVQVCMHPPGRWCKSVCTHRVDGACLMDLVVRHDGQVLDDVAEHALAVGGALQKTGDALHLLVIIVFPEDKKTLAVK